MAPSIKLLELQEEVRKNKAKQQTGQHERYIRNYSKAIRGVIQELTADIKQTYERYGDPFDISSVKGFGEADASTVLEQENVIIQECLNTIYRTETCPDYAEDDEGLPLELSEYVGNNALKERWLDTMRAELNVRRKEVPPTVPTQEVRYSTLLHETYASAYAKRSELMNSRIKLERPGFRLLNNAVSNTCSKSSNVLRLQLSDALAELQQYEVREHARLVAEISSKEPVNAELDYLIQERAIEKRALRESLEQQDHQKLAQERARMIQNKAQQLQTKELLAQWRRELLERQLEEAEIEQQIQDAFAQEQAELLKFNQERSQFRSGQLQKKQQEREEKAAKYIKDQEVRERRLQALRASVAVTAVRDLQRAIGPTFASELVGVGWSTKKPDGPALFAVHGFKGEFTDVRTQVSNALTAAGMQGSDYGRAILASLPAPKGFRKDMQTTG